MRPGSTRTSRPFRTSAAGPARALTRCTASCTRPSSGSPAGPSGSVRRTSGSARSARCSTRPPAGSPFWYASNSPLLERYPGRLMERTAEWESRWWSPVINAEHLAMRDAAALVDLSAFAVLEISGPAALDAVQNLSVAQLNLPVGRVVYTSWLDENGGFRSDLTVMRLAEY